MKRNIYYVMTGIIALFLLIAGAGFYRFNFTNGGDILPGVNVADPKNTSYMIGEATFTLTNGFASKSQDNQKTPQGTLQLFGEPVYGDLDADGDLDAAVLLVNNTEGSGVFYYAALVFSQGSEMKSTKGMLLGDRIAPQTVEIHDGRAVYNYAVRRSDEPMTSQASIGKSTWIHYDKKTGDIGEWVKDFEGESALPHTKQQ